jgi:hypothetical protein
MIEQPKINRWSGCLNNFEGLIKRISKGDQKAEWVITEIYTVTRIDDIVCKDSSPNTCNGDFFARLLH